LVEALADEFRFCVVTSAWDDPTAGPMPSVASSRWITSDVTTVWYESNRQLPGHIAARLMKATEPQLVYINSLFDFRFAILPLLVARTRFRSVPVLLAPRGELSAGALALKRQKKSLFIAAFRLLRLHEAVTWHASTIHEKRDIERVFGPNLSCRIALDLRTGLLGHGADRSHVQPPPDDPMVASLIFFSRIVPKKNLAGAIRAVSHVKGTVRLTIAGPIEDTEYWDRCLELINELPDPGLVRYVGTIPAAEVVNFLDQFDLFVFPTLGENFGHVVLESLAAGTPVIVGTDTPWDRIETSGAGWVCDPNRPDTIAERIDDFLSLDSDTRAGMRTAARNLALDVLNDPSAVEANRLMFRDVVATGAP
jgi:glycosyltransferase involved in cell wall biosynthesis